MNKKPKKQTHIKENKYAYTIAPVGTYCSGTTLGKTGALSSYNSSKIKVISSFCLEFSLYIT